MISPRSHQDLTTVHTLYFLWLREEGETALTSLSPPRQDSSNSLSLQRRRGSKDAAGDEKSEWERRLDKPSVPLKAIGEPGPPRIVEIQEKYGAVEGRN